MPYFVTPSPLNCYMWEACPPVNLDLCFCLGTGDYDGRYWINFYMTGNSEEDGVIWNYADKHVRDKDFKWLSSIRT